MSLGLLEPQFAAVPLVQSFAETIEHGPRSLVLPTFVEQDKISRTKVGRIQCHDISRPCTSVDVELSLSEKRPMRRTASCCEVHGLDPKRGWRASVPALPPIP